MCQGSEKRWDIVYPLDITRVSSRQFTDGTLGETVVFDSPTHARSCVYYVILYTTEFIRRVTSTQVLHCTVLFSKFQFPGMAIARAAYRITILPKYRFETVSRYQFETVSRYHIELHWCFTILQPILSLLYLVEKYDFFFIFSSVVSNKKNLQMSLASTYYLAC